MPSALARFEMTVMAAAPELFDLIPQEIVSKANGGELDIVILLEELELVSQISSVTDTIIEG
jgi:hypothetical protein